MNIKALLSSAAVFGILASTAAHAGTPVAAVEEDDPYAVAAVPSVPPAAIAAAAGVLVLAAIASSGDSSDGTSGTSGTND